MSRALLIVFFCAALAACGSSGDGSSGNGPSGNGGAPTGGLDASNLAAELVPPENGQLPADLLPPA
jgi:hypothetical protein